MGYCPICNHRPIAPSCVSCPKCGNQEWLLETGSKKSDSCSVCNGTGINSQCSYCHGEGRFSGAVSCETGSNFACTPYSQRAVCDKCNGTGKNSACWACAGTGRSNCKKEYTDARSGRTQWENVAHSRSNRN